MNPLEQVGVLGAFVLFVAILFALPYLPVLALGLPYWQAFGWTWGVMYLLVAISSIFNKSK